jgi:signal transduction histidine kinase
VSVEDDGPGFDPNSRPTGHGLDLLGGRLAMLFGDRAAMRVESRPGRSLVTIEVPDNAGAAFGRATLSASAKATADPP